MGSAFVLPVVVMNQHLTILAFNIRARRAQLKLSQEKLAERCHLHRTYVCDIEHARRNVSFDALLRIAAGLETTLSQLTANIEAKYQDLVPLTDLGMASVAPVPFHNGLHGGALVSQARLS
jgi:DNA-binding XRE family transcriptional regulator